VPLDRAFEQPPEWDQPHVQFFGIAAKHGTIALAGGMGASFDFGTGLEPWQGRDDIVLMLLDAPAQAE
jgi:hypothetical protein